MGNPVIEINIYQVAPKVKGCPKCEAIDSEEQGCGCCLKDNSSEEEVEGGCGCNKKPRFRDEEVQTSEEESHGYCSQEQQTSNEEFSEESQSSEEQKTCDNSSEEIPEVSYCHCARNKQYESSEEIQAQSSEKKCQSSEEIPEVSREYCQCRRNKPYESSEEIQTQSSEECPKTKESSEEEAPEESFEDDSGEIYEEEHWCRGRPTKIRHKSLGGCRYSNSDECGKRFSRSKRELFLDDMHDFSVYTEPLTRNQIQKTIGKIIANSTSIRKRKGKRRQRNRHLVQNKDQFEEHNKLRQILKEDDEDLIVNGKPNQVLETPKELEGKLEEEILSKQNEERNKRHSKCRTIEHLKRKPKYDMNVLADAGCSQYIPEIISDESCELVPKNGVYDYILANRNKRHLSTFDGNLNFPIKFVDATKRTNPHVKKVQYRRHHHPKHHHPKNQASFAVDPKFYYKYLSLTAPDLSTRQLDPKDLPEDGKIVFDHLGHKFLEYNGFRTLIKPKIDYIDDAFYEKPKFWTCKEDLIDPKDFGKVTTISEDLETTTIGINLTTEAPKNSTDIEDLEAHEFNLCEYLKNLELTQNVEVQQEAKTVFLQNCEDYIKFLIFNPSNEDKANITESVSNYLENLLHNSLIKNHFKKLFHTKHKFENNLANITNLLHKPKVIDNFKNYLLFKNEFDSMKSKLNLNEYSMLHFFADAEFVLNFEKISTTTDCLTTKN